MKTPPKWSGVIRCTATEFTQPKKKTLLRAQVTKVGNGVIYLKLCLTPVEVLGKVDKSCS